MIRLHELAPSPTLQMQTDSQSHTPVTDSVPFYEGTVLITNIFPSMGPCICSSEEITAHLVLLTSMAELPYNILPPLGNI